MCLKSSYKSFSAGRITGSRRDSSMREPVSDHSIPEVPETRSRKNDVENVKRQDGDAGW